MHQRQPRMQYPIAISRPKKMIQIRLTRKEKPPPPYTTSFPNGKKARLANLKHCRPTGMPMMVMHQRQPASTQASPPINPPNRNQRIFPIVDIVVTSISRYFASVASCRSIHAISNLTMRFCSSSVSSRPMHEIKSENRRRSQSNSIVRSLHLKLLRLMMASGAWSKITSPISNLRRSSSATRATPIVKLLNYAESVAKRLKSALPGSAKYYLIIRRTEL